MQAERGVRDPRIFSEGVLDGQVSRAREANLYATIPISSSSSVSSLSSPYSFSPLCANYIEHRVSKMDTLAGVAIKYGVEVADIRRMNGLVTDLQMFARKSLKIPMPGRHPPSTLMSNGSTKNGEKPPPFGSKDKFIDSLQSLKLKPTPHNASPAMCSLQGYYGLRQPNKGTLPEGTEMAVYKSGKTLFLEDDMPASDPTCSTHRKTKSWVKELLLENVDFTDDITESDGPIRRQQKADANPPRASGILLKEESSFGAFQGRAAGKGLALRPKTGNSTDIDTGRQNSTIDADSIINVFVSVRKSVSTSNLSESDNKSSILLPLKPDAIARPIFYGLPKPITARRNKAALD